MIGRKIDPSGRFSYTKHKRRAGAYIFVSTVLSLGLMSACDDLNPAFKTSFLERHFDENRAAFKAIEAELLDDDEVKEVSSCPRESDRCLYFETASESQVRFEEKYQPLLVDLNFPGSVFFSRSLKGFYDFPNMGHAYANGYVISASLRLYPSGERDTKSCDGYSPVKFDYACERALDDAWVIHWSGYNDEMMQACIGQETYDACSLESLASGDDYLCFMECTDKLDAEALAEQAQSKSD